MVMKLTDKQRKAIFAKYAEEEKIREETIKQTQRLDQWL